MNQISPALAAETEQLDRGLGTRAGGHEKVTKVTPSRVCARGDAVKVKLGGRDMVIDIPAPCAFPAR